MDDTTVYSANGVAVKRIFKDLARAALAGVVEATAATLVLAVVFTAAVW